jgi:amino acid transporter
MKKLSALNLFFIIIGSVDSIRNIPSIAISGEHLASYFFFATFIFLLPTTIVICWLIPVSEKGVFGWVKEGLGEKYGLLAIWLQCLQNIFCFPTLLSFIVGTFLYALDPMLVENKWVVFSLLNTLFWLLTLFNLKDLLPSARFNQWCVFIGLVLPFLLIWGGAGFVYFYQGSSVTHSHLLNETPSNAITAIILSFCGIEVATVYRNRTRMRSLIKACLWSVPFIALSLFVSAYCLQTLVSVEKLSLISGINQTLDVIFTKLGFPSLTGFMSVLIGVGCIGTVNAWLRAPAEGLSYAIRDFNPRSKLALVNRHHSPVGLLFLQALLVTLISSLYLFSHSINQSYWLMLTLTTIMYLGMYFLMFLAAIRLAIKKKSVFIIPVALLGVLGATLAFLNAIKPEKGGGMFSLNLIKYLLFFVIVFSPFFLGRLRKIKQTHLY